MSSSSRGLTLWASRPIERRLCYVARQWMRCVKRLLNDEFRQCCRMVEADMGHKKGAIEAPFFKH